MGHLAQKSPTIIGSFAERGLNLKALYASSLPRSISTNLLYSPSHIKVQHTATHCNILQHTATHCITTNHLYSLPPFLLLSLSLFSLSLPPSLLLSHTHPLSLLCTSSPFHLHAHMTPPLSLLQTGMCTGWPRPAGCLIFIGHFLRESPIISGSFAERDLQIKASYASSQPCTRAMQLFVVGTVPLDRVRSTGLR